MKKKGLGRGLAAIFSEAEEDYGKNLLFDEGDEIITFTPSYEQFSSLAKSIHANVLSLPLYEENNWKYDLNEIEKNIHENTKAIVIIKINQFHILK